MRENKVTEPAAAVFPDPREPSRLFPPGGPFAPHHCCVCLKTFEVGQHIYNYGQGECVHTACRFLLPKEQA